MHYDSKNIGAYAKQTGRLTMLEHGAYNLIMDAYYDREKAPTKAEAIEWAWARLPEEVAAVEFVLARFFTLDGDVYRQSRIDEELQHYHGICLANAANGKKGGRPKSKPKANQTETHPVILETQSVTDGLPNALKNNPNESLNQEPITKNQEPVKTLAVSDKSLPAVQVKKIGFDYAEKRWVGLQENASQIKIWAETYPGVDLRAEFMEMKSWLTSNPANRKTNLSRFINNWLKKSQDRASRPENKTFYERTKDQKQADAEKRYEGLLNADYETLKKWGLA